MPNPLGSKLRSKTFLPTSKTERVNEERNAWQGGPAAGGGSGSRHHGHLGRRTLMLGKLLQGHLQTHGRGIGVEDGVVRSNN